MEYRCECGRMFWNWVNAAKHKRKCGQKISIKKE